MSLRRTITWIAFGALCVSGVTLQAQDNRGGLRLEVDGPATRQKLAICIGVNHYLKGSGYGQLEFAAADASAVAQSLIEDCDFSRVLLVADTPDSTRLEEHCDKRLKITTDTTRDSIRKCLEEIFQASQNLDDLFLIYFAGHGDVAGTAFLVPSDYHQQSAPLKKIWLSEILEYLVTAKARHRVLVLDSCRSSPLSQQGQTMAVAFRTALQDLDHRLAVLTACDVDESSHEDETLGHGRFSWALVNALRHDKLPPQVTTLTADYLYSSIFSEFEQHGWLREQHPQRVIIGEPISLYERGARVANVLNGLGQTFTDLLTQAQQAYRRNDLETAQRAYQECLNLRERGLWNTNDEAQYAEVLAGLTLTQYRLGDRERATQLMRQIEQEARVPGAYYEVVGMREADSGDDASAIHQYAKAVNAYPTEMPATAYLWYRDAISKTRIADLSQAAESFKRAAQQSDAEDLTDDGDYFLLQAAETLEQAGQVSKALQIYKQLITRHGESKGISFTLISALDKIRSLSDETAIGTEIAGKRKLLAAHMDKVLGPTKLAARSPLEDSLLPMHETPRFARQEWAERMFNTLEHDFGLVARDSEAVYRFEITNIYKQPMEITGVWSSSLCVSPTIENTVINTYEKAYLVAKFNTHALVGMHGATLTVSFAPPYAAEVQVRVHGDIRGDVVFTPGAIDFGKVDEGEPREQRLTVSHAGRSDWKIVGITNYNDFFEVEMTEAPKTPGKVTYNLLVRMKDNVPAGFIKDQLTVVTNDSRPESRRIPLLVKGQVVPEISVTPETLVLGNIQAGEPVTRKVVVRGKKPFKILDVDCGDNCFSFNTDDESKVLHLIEITYTPGDQPGAVKVPVTITTDRKNYVAILTVSADIVATQPATEARTQLDNQ